MTTDSMEINPKLKFNNKTKYSFAKKGRPQTVTHLLHCNSKVEFELRLAMVAVVIPPPTIPPSHHIFK